MEVLVKLFFGILPFCARLLKIFIKQRQGLEVLARPALKDVQKFARPTLWLSAFRGSFTSRPCKLFLNSRGSAQAPDARELRAPILQKLKDSSTHVLLRDPLKLQGQWHCSRCGHTIAHTHIRECC